MNAKESQDDSMPPWLVGTIGFLLVLFGIWGFVGEEADWNYPAAIIAIALSAIVRAYARQAETHARLAQTVVSVLVVVAGVLVVLGLFL